MASVGVSPVICCCMVEFLSVGMRFPSGGEAVGHDHVEHVGGGKSLRPLHVPALIKLEIARYGLLAVFPLQLHCAGPGFRRYVEIDVLPVAASVEPDHRVDPHARILGGEFRVAYIGAIYLQLKGIVAHPGPPVGRVYLINRNGCHGLRGHGSAYQKRSFLFLHNCNYINPIRKTSNVKRPT